MAEKNLLHEALSTLSVVEIREFGKFVRSPFFNNRPQLSEYFDAWVHAQSGQQALPNTRNADVSMRLTHSALLALLEKYGDSDTTHLTMLQGRLSQWQKLREQNTMSPDELSRQRNQIRHAILELAAQLP